MNANVKWLILAAMLLFLGYIVYDSIARVEAQCEVCLEFRGELTCRLGAGATEEEARQAAQESACGGNVSGMSELIACRNRTPDRMTCSVN
jgi:hypothetical protein